MLGPRYDASAHWGPRQETPEMLAHRWMLLFARLRAIDPQLRDWFEWHSDDMLNAVDYRSTAIAECIARHVARDDFDEPEPESGFFYSAYNKESPDTDPRTFAAKMFAGGLSSNRVSFNTENVVTPDDPIVDYRIFKDALIALAETFDAAYGVTYPTDIMNLWPAGRTYFRIFLGWMAYVSPRYAGVVSPPSSAIVEYRPDGGLFMAATDETFVTSNPRHLAVARDIEAAVAPLNAIPWPLEENFPRAALEGRRR